MNELHLELTRQKAIYESQQQAIDGVKNLAEETSQIIAEGLTEFRTVLDHHDKDIVRIDQIVRSGNGSKPLIVRIALLEQELPNVKSEMIAIKDKIHQDHLKLLESVTKAMEEREAKALEDKKDRRSSRVAIIVAILSLLGTVVTAALSYFKP